MNKPLSTIGANVRAELARHGKSQSALAQVLGIAQPGVSKRLAGTVEFGAGELIKVATFLGVPVSSFYVGTDQEDSRTDAVGPQAVR